MIMTGSVPELEARLGSQEAAVVRLDPHPDRRPERGRAGRAPVRPAASRAARAGSLVAAPRGGWIAVYDDVCDRNPEMLRRLARELSDRMGAVTLLLGVEREELVRMILFERGRIVDEYLSVPEFYGPLPPGDVVGLAANPTVISRLTGADPETVRHVARTAPSPADLPPARELLAQLAAAMHVEGVGDGLGGRAGARRLGADRARVTTILLLHGWPVSERVVGVPGAALCATPVTTSGRRICTDGAPRSTTGLRRSCVRSTARSCRSGRRWAGYCALALARRAPERVVGMALVASRADADSFERRRARLEHDHRAPCRAGCRSARTRMPISSTWRSRRRRCATAST